MNHIAPEAHIENAEAWSGKDRGEENFPVGSLLISNCAEAVFAPPCNGLRPEVRFTRS